MLMGTNSAANSADWLNNSWSMIDPCLICLSKPDPFGLGRSKSRYQTLLNCHSICDFCCKMYHIQYICVFVGFLLVQLLLYL